MLTGWVDDNRATVGPHYSKLWTPHFNRHFAQVHIAFQLTAIQYNPGNANTPLFHKAAFTCNGHV